MVAFCHFETAPSGSCNDKFTQVAYNIIIARMLPPGRRSGGKLFQEESQMNELRLRVALPSDAPRLLAIYAPYVSQTAVTLEYEAPTEEEFAERIRGTLKKYPYIVAEYGSDIVGYAYAGAFRVRPSYRWDVETSIYVRRDMKKRGVGRELYEKLEILLSRQHVANMYAFVAIPGSEDEYLTRDSFEFHKHVGYRQAGELKKCACKFDRWYNMAIMEKSIGPHASPQPEFIPFPMLNER